ncbi:MAG: metallophosphoesterase [Candidatus Aenigmarchaeota archaeon]|nr:metallophosphoesterase [Candidatus Aenigmarchaeota archaeon]
MAKKKIGVISDMHGKDVSKAVEVFREEGVDFILSNGDYVNSLWKYGRDDEKYLKEIESAISGLASCGKDVFVIPGNHEPRTHYAAVMENVCKKFPNVRDMTKTEIFLKDEFAIVPYGGSVLKGFGKDSFTHDPAEDAQYLAKLFEDNFDRKIIFQSHEPPREYGDYTFHAGSIGSIDLTVLIEGGYGNPIPLLAVAGHIHESHAFKSPGKSIPECADVGENEQVSNLSLNAAAYKDGRVGVVEIDGDKVSYRIRKIDFRK